MKNNLTGIGCCTLLLAVIFLSTGNPVLPVMFIFLTFVIELCFSGDC